MSSSSNNSSNNNSRASASSATTTTTTPIAISGRGSRGAKPTPSSSDRRRHSVVSKIVGSETEDPFDEPEMRPLEEDPVVVTEDLEKMSLQKKETTRATSVEEHKEELHDDDNDEEEETTTESESNNTTTTTTTNASTNRANAIKNLAKGYLDGTKGKSKSNKECCPEDQQQEDGTGGCACPSDGHHGHAHHHHDHSHNAVPPGMPSEMGRQLAAAPAVSVLVLGDPGVGKTSFLNRHMTGQPTMVHEPTPSVGVAQLLFATNHGFIKVHVIDTMGSKPVGGLDKDYYHAVQAVMILFDVTNPKSYKNATKQWLRDADSIHPSLPKILLGNKTDMEAQRKIMRRDISFHKKKHQYYFDLSVKAMTNIEIPFLCLLLEITGISDLRFVQVGEEGDPGTAMQIPEEAPKTPPGLVK